MIEIQLSQSQVTRNPKLVQQVVNQGKKFIVTNQGDIVYVILQYLNDNKSISVEDLNRIGKLRKRHSSKLKYKNLTAEQMEQLAYDENIS